MSSFVLFQVIRTAASNDNETVVSKFYIVYTDDKFGLEGMESYASLTYKSLFRNCMQNSDI